MSFTVNASKFQTATKDYLHYLKLDASKELVRQGKLLVEDAIYMTPPYPKGEAGSGVGAVNSRLNDHRRAGEKAVIRDMKKLFKPIQRDVSIPRGITDTEWKKFQVYDRDPKKAKHLTDSIRKYAEAGDTGKLGDLFRKMKIRQPGLIETANNQLLNSHRNRRGKVVGKDFYLVLKNEGLGQLLKKQLAMVGMAKSGWKRAYAACGGANLPAWISRHNGAGIFDKNLNDLKSLWVKVGNAVPYIQATGAELQIIQKAMNNRARNLKIEMEVLLNRRAKKFNSHR